MIYKKILRERPRTNLHEHIAAVFAKDKALLQKEINLYVQGRVRQIFN